MPRERILAALLAVIVGLLAITAVKPYNRSTWFMEVAPVLVAGPILVLTGSVVALMTLSREQDRQMENFRRPG